MEEEEQIEIQIEDLNEEQIQDIKESSERLFCNDSNIREVLERMFNVLRE